MSVFKDMSDYINKVQNDALYHPESDATPEDFLRDDPNPADIIFQVELAVIGNPENNKEEVFKKLKRALNYGLESSDSYETFCNTVVKAKGKISASLQQTFPLHYINWLKEIGLESFLTTDFENFYNLIDEDI